MSGELVNFPGVTKLDTDPARVLQSAMDAKLERVVIIGYGADEEEYFASSIADGGEVVWLIERMKLKLLRYADKEE